MGAAKVYQPVTEVVISKDDITAMMNFWAHFNVPFIKVPGLPELVDEIMAKDSISVDDCERVKYLVCYEVAYSTHPTLANDSMWTLIRRECKDMVAVMDSHYPGRVWI